MTVDSESLLMLSVTIFALFLALSFVDGVILHLVRYRLPENLGSKFEHRLHTFRAVLFVPTVFFLYFQNVSGVLLWFTLALVLIDFYFQAVDILEERRSRMRLGGLTSGEYLLHVFESSLHVAAVVLVFVSKPAEAWRRAVELPAYGDDIKLAASIFLAGGVAIAGLHLALIPYPFLMTKMLGNFGRKKTA